MNKFETLGGKSRVRRLKQILIKLKEYNFHLSLEKKKYYDHNIFVTNYTCDEQKKKI